MTSLPLPDAAALEHSQRVREHLNKKMRLLGGQIAFDSFMQEVLYAPGFGYYNAGAQKFGAAGDFVTAPEISPLFGRTLAHALAPHFLAHRSDNLLELGPGSGQLACDLGLELATLGAFPHRYYLLEVSADLKQRQQARLAKCLSPALLARCEWLERLPPHFDGVILGNEVLDALAVHLFRIDAAGPLTAQVQLTTDDHWHINFTVPYRHDVAERIEWLQQRYQLPVGYQSEVNLWQEALLNSLSHMLRRGLMLFIDYGFEAAVYYHPQRTQGTLCCHYRHHVHADPLWLPGLQDITSHVDFTALATCGLSAGLNLELYCQQAEFLLAHGILDLGAATTDSVALLRQSQALQKLLAPHEMGELFKVMVFNKNSTPLFSTLAERDRRHSL